MANEGIRGVLDEVETMAASVSGRRGSTHENALAAVTACRMLAARATAESARGIAIAIMVELASTLAEGDRIGAESVAKVGG